MNEYRFVMFHVGTQPSDAADDVLA